ncbi:glycoside hydrolase family 76 protein [Diplocarpon rosae]|nr:glycoside hydrolase family 76 protein [Diplocarpon rosae]
MILPLSVRSLVTATVAISSRENQVAPPETSRAAVNPELAQTASSAINALGNFYSKERLQWTNISSWVAANVYNDIMDFDLFANTKQYEETYGASLRTVATSPDAQKAVQSVNEFNDDQLWWCLAMIRAYQNYGHKELLDQSIKQWKDIGADAQVFKSDQGTTVTKGGIKRDMPIPADCDVDGAVYWSSETHSALNAISTSLYAQVGAWLWAITQDQAFRGPTDSALGWLQRRMLDSKTGIMAVDALVPDGCELKPGALTYNTGVYIGALTSMYMSSRDTKYLDAATLSATSTANGAFGNNYDANLVITEESELVERKDAVQWRDALFRNMADFYITIGAAGAISDGLKSNIKAFFQANYDRVQQQARFGDLYAANWWGKLNTGSDWGTGSVLGLLVGAALVL